MVIMSFYPFGVENNTANGTSRPETPELPKDIYVLYIIKMGMAMTGLLANLLCFTTLLHHTQRPLNKTPHLISLAVSDFIFLWSFPIMVRSRYIGNEPPGPGWCNVVNYIGLVMLTVSNINLMLFTSGRMISVYYPTKVTSILTRRNTCISIALLWTVTPAVYIPVLLAYLPSWPCKVVPGWKWAARYYGPYIQLVIANAIPDTVLFVANIAIVVRIGRIRRRNSTLSISSAATQRDERYSSVIGVCIGLGIFHLITTLPVMLDISIFRKPGTVPGLYHFVLNAMATTNHACNFVLYMALSESFREAFIMTIHCRWS